MLQTLSWSDWQVVSRPNGTVGQAFFGVRYRRVAAGVILTHQGGRDSSHFSVIYRMEIPAAGIHSSSWKKETVCAIKLKSPGVLPVIPGKCDRRLLGYHPKSVVTIKRNERSR